MYQLQLCAISLPHHVRSKVRVDWEQGTGRNWKTGRLIREEAEDKAGMRHTKTLVCNQVTGAVRIVVVCRQLPQSSQSAPQCLTRMQTYLISDTTRTTAILLLPLSQRIKERNKLPFLCQLVPQSFIYPVIDPCHTFSFSRGAY